MTETPAFRLAPCAGMVKLVDTADLDSAGQNRKASLRVRIPFPVLYYD